MNPVGRNSHNKAMIITCVSRNDMQVMQILFINNMLKYNFQSSFNCEKVRIATDITPIINQRQLLCALMHIFKTNA